MDNSLKPLQAMLAGLLRRSRPYGWTVQGFGMLRIYLDTDKRWRLNIWDDRLGTPGVSVIHDHPWSFTSYVLAGEVTNIRYMALPDLMEATHHYQEIVTGEEGGPRGPIRSCCLSSEHPEDYRAGEWYSQKLDEIHHTQCVRGTVTLNDRTKPTLAHTARVFWPVGSEWVDAKPRPATGLEIEMALGAVAQLLKRQS